MPENCIDYGHYSIPIRVRIRGAIQFCKHMSIKYFKENVFQILNVFYCQSYEFLCNNLSLHQLYNDSNQKEICGHFWLISAKKLYEMEHILQEKGIKACVII